MGARAAQAAVTAGAKALRQGCLDRGELGSGGGSDVKARTKGTGKEAKVVTRPRPVVVETVSSAGVWYVL